MATYNPTRKIPTLTPEIESRIGARLKAIWAKEPVDDKLTHAERFRVTEEKLTDTEWFEALFIAAIFAAAVHSPLKTVGDAWGPIMFQVKNNPRVKGWNEAKMQQHVAAAADTVIGLMSA